MWISWRMKWWSWMWFKQGQIEVECGDENDYESGEYGNEGGDGHAIKTFINNTNDKITDDNTINEINDDLLL